MKVLEERIDRNTILSLSTYQFPDFVSLDLVVYRFNENNGLLNKIGIASVFVKGKSADWNDTLIYDSAERNKGLGSKMVKFLVDYMTDLDVREVIGEISSVDDMEKAAHFWKKNGFTVDEDALAKDEYATIKLKIKRTENNTKVFFRNHKIERRNIRG